MNFFDLTDDLGPSQFQQLLHWLWVHQTIPTRRALKKWRKDNNLPID